MGGNIVKGKGPRFFKKSRRHLKIQASDGLHKTSFNDEDVQMLGVTVQNVVSWAIRHPEIVQPWLKVLLE